MKNSKLMEKVKELATQTLHTREQSHRVMVQIAIIRKTFGVKNNETETKQLISFDYDRKPVLSDDEIRKEFNVNLGFLDWAIGKNDADKKREFSNQIEYFIDAVNFFNHGLADEFKMIALQRN